MDLLPVEMLFDIFLRVPSQERRCTLPLVCKSWNEIVSQPSALWHQMAFDLRNQTAILVGPARRFFSLHGAQLRSLSLTLPGEEAGLAATALAALGTATPLKRLVVDFGGAKAVSAATFLAQLGWVASLKVLGIQNLQGPIGGRGLLGLRRLHHLKAIQLSFARAAAPNLPDGFPMELLHCKKLEALHISYAGEYAFRMLPDGLSQLQNLKEIGFTACGVHGFGRNFVALTNLETLTVYSTSPPRHMKFPQDLSAMAKLTFVDVTSREIPVPLGSLPNLKHLTLQGLRPSCRGSHDVQTEFASLLADLSLESLTIQNSRLGAVPHAVTSQCSFNRLVLRSCGLTCLPDGPYLRLLSELDLSGNDIEGNPLEGVATPMLKTYIPSGCMLDWTNDLENFSV